MKPDFFKTARANVASVHADRLIWRLSQRVYKHFVLNAKSDDLIFKVRDHVSCTAPDVAIRVFAHFHTEGWLIHYDTTQRQYTIGYRAVLNPEAFRT
jgi:hypothetical protein